MACHLAGVGTAVATCGTAFGDDHARVLRRFLDDRDGSRGEVIFTFDGDAAGQKRRAAGVRRRPELRVPDLRRGRARRARPVRPAHQEGRRGGPGTRGRPGAAHRFVLSNVVGKYDLDRATVASTRCARARAWSRASGTSPRSTPSRELAGMVGLDPDERARRGQAGEPPASRAGRAAGRDDGARPPRSRGATCRAWPTRGSRRARDPDARRPAPDDDRSAELRHRPRRLHPSGPASGVGWSPPPGAWAPGSATPGGRRSSARPPTTRGGVDHQRLGRGAAEEVARRGVRDRLPPASPGADRHPPDRRRALAPAAGRSRRRRRVQRLFGELAALESQPSPPARPAGGAGPDAAATPYPLSASSGERLLADAAATQAHLGGTRDALYVVRHRGPGPRARRDRPDPGRRSRRRTGTLRPRPLRVSEVGSWGSSDRSTSSRSRTRSSSSWSASA